MLVDCEPQSRLFLEVKLKNISIFVIFARQGPKNPFRILFLERALYIETWPPKAVLATQSKKFLPVFSKKFGCRGNKSWHFFLIKNQQNFVGHIFFGLIEQYSWLCLPSDVPPPFPVSSSNVATSLNCYLSLFKPTFLSLHPMLPHW